MTDKKIKDELSIDLYNLWEEELRQASLLDQAGKDRTDSIYERDKIKQKLGVQKATIAQDARKNPKSYDIDKTTDKVIADVVTLDKEVQKLELEFIETTKILNNLSVRVESLEGKSRSLYNLSEQSKVGLINTTNVVSNGVEEDIVKKELTKNLTKKLKRGGKRA